MAPPVDVAVFLLVIFADGVDHLPGLLRRGGIVEIDQRPLVYLLVQDREIGPDIFYVEAHTFGLYYKNTKV